MIASCVSLPLSSGRKRTPSARGDTSPALGALLLLLPPLVARVDVIERDEPCPPAMDEPPVAALLHMACKKPKTTLSSGSAPMVTASAAVAASASSGAT